MEIVDRVNKIAGFAGTSDGVSGAEKDEDRKIDLLPDGRSGAGSHKRDSRGKSGKSAGRDQGPVEQGRIRRLSILGFAIEYGFERR